MYSVDAIRGFEDVRDNGGFREMSRIREKPDTRKSKSLCGTMTIVLFAIIVGCLVAFLGVLRIKQSPSVEHFACSFLWDIGAWEPFALSDFSRSVF